jgi:hypothetical protein
MPRIQPVGRSRLDPETQTLLKTISGGESRWNVFEGIANHPATLSAMDGLRKAIDDRLTTQEQQPQLLVIQQFVRAALEKKGMLDDEEFSDFQSRDIPEDKMIVILAEIALYTLLNYFNRLAGTEIETQILPFVSEQAIWIKEPDR